MDVLEFLCYIIKSFFSLRTREVSLFKMSKIIDEAVDLGKLSFVCKAGS